MPHFKSAGEKLQAANEILLLVQALQGKHTLQTHWTLLRKRRRREYSNTHNTSVFKVDISLCVSVYMWIPPELFTDF